MNGILFDSDYLIAATFESESTHEMAAAISKNIKHSPQFIIVPTLYELATVTSRKFGHAKACRLIKSIYELDIEQISVDHLEQDILDLFYTQNKKSTSLFDCANLVAARHYGFKIASFDGFYPKTILAR